MRRRRNPSESNPYGINDRVWGRIVGSEDPTLSRIMFAAALDPLLIHELDEIQPPRSFVECVQLADMGSRGNLRSYLKSVLIKWVMSNSDDVSSMARQIASWDKHLGSWCALACAESVLRFIPAGEDRPSIAVEAAKGWLLSHPIFGVVDQLDAVLYAAEDAEVYADAIEDAAEDAATASAEAYADAIFIEDDAAYAAANAAHRAAASLYAARYAAEAAAHASFAAADVETADATYDAVKAAVKAHADAARYVAKYVADAAANDADAYSSNIAYYDAPAAAAVRNVIVYAIETYPVDQP